MSITNDHARGWRNRTKVALACAVVSATAMLPVACGLPGGEAEAEPGAAAKPSVTAAPVPKADPAVVKKAYVAYEKASLAKDGAAVESMITENSKTYYENVRKLALTASKATLSKKRLVDQVTVLGLRADADPAVLRKGSVTDLIQASLDSPTDFNEETDTEDVEKSKVTFRGDRATITDAETPEVSFDLVREDGAWKVDIRSVYEMLDGLLNDLADLTGGSKTAFVEQALAQQVGGKAKAKALWKPIGTGRA